MQTPTITATSLYFREGNSAKEYHLAVEPAGEGYIVTYAADLLIRMELG